MICLLNKTRFFSDDDTIIPECRLLYNLGVVFDEQRFTDVTLIIGDKNLPTHKIILAAQSPVFAAMFQHEMQEKINSTVEITDVDYEIMKVLIKFMYTGCAPDIDNIADRLLAAAEKYGLERLKAICEKSLCTNLSIETAAHTLVVADLHSADHLKAKTIHFIVQSYGTAVMDTTEWKNMISTHPHLVAEVCRAIKQ